MISPVRNIKEIASGSKIFNRINSIRNTTKFVKSKISKGVKSLLDIFYPNFCLVCKRYLPSNSDGEIVCNFCWQSIERNIPPFCYRCGIHLSAREDVCPDCFKKVFYFDRLWSACFYEGVMSELICLFKYKGYDFLGKRLSKILIDFIREFTIPLNLIDFVIPIPLHPKKLREREFNQSEILAEELAKEFNLRLSYNLIRIKDTKPQVALSEDRRFYNVKDAFVVKEKIEFRDKNILLVDDVSTTGATLSWGSFALKEAGTRRIFCLTLARTRV